MNQEIERKFLIKNDSWRQNVTGSHVIRQGYIHTVARNTVRVRLRDGQAFLTLKSRTAPDGLGRSEFEYGIPADDAAAMLDTLCDRPLIEKVRYLVPADNGLVWEIDVFSGDNAGLTVAEIELPSADTPFTHPAWLGEEVTADPRYYNAALTQMPYSQWKNK